MSLAQVRRGRFDTQTMARLGTRRSVMGPGGQCRGRHWFWGRRDAQGRAGRGGATYSTINVPRCQTGHGGCVNGRNSMQHGLPIATFHRGLFGYGNPNSRGLSRGQSRVCGHCARNQSSYFTPVIGPLGGMVVLSKCAGVDRVIHRIEALSVP